MNPDENCVQSCVSSSNFYFDEQHKIATNVGSIGIPDNPEPSQGGGSNNGSQNIYFGNTATDFQVNSHLVGKPELSSGIPNKAPRLRNAHRFKIISALTGK